MAPTDPNSRAATLAKAWLFHLELAAWIAAGVLALAGALGWAATCAALALVVDVGGRRWSRSTPVPMPYFMRWVLHLPRGPQSPAGLLRVLQPRAGERILELGPGVGVHALPVARALAPDGVLDVLDVQREMLDELERRAAARGIANIRARRGDARALPYVQCSFDAAYLISVLGEIPEPAAALSELRRVLRPDGRLVVGEVVVDPDFVPLRALRAQAQRAGFVLERSSGPRFAYLALLRPAPPSDRPTAWRKPCPAPTPSSP